MTSSDLTHQSVTAVVAERRRRAAVDRRIRLARAVSDVREWRRARAWRAAAQRPLPPAILSPCIRREGR